MPEKALNTCIHRIRSGAKKFEQKVSIYTASQHRRARRTPTKYIVAVSGRLKRCSITTTPSLCNPVGPAPAPTAVLLLVVCCCHWHLRCKERKGETNQQRRKEHARAEQLVPLQPLRFWILRVIPHKACHPRNWISCCRRVDDFPRYMYVAVDLLAESP